MQPETSNAQETTIIPTQPEPKKRGILFYFIIFYIIWGLLQFLVGFIYVFDPIENSISTEDVLEIKLFLSSNSKLNTPQKEIDFEVTTTSKQVEFDYTITEEDVNKRELFLYAFGSLKNKKKEDRIKEKFGLSKEEPLLFSQISLFEYILKVSKRIEDEFSDDFPVSSVESKENDKNIKVLYIKPNITLYISSNEQIESYSVHEYRALNIPLRSDLKSKSFLPLFCLSDFWVIKNEYQEINSSQNINFKIDIRLSPLTKLKYMIALQANDKVMESSGIGSGKDMFVYLLKNNSSSYLTLLFTVQSLHLIFSFLGFANDISHHKSLKKMDGLFTKIYFIRMFHYLIAVVYYYMEDVNKIIYFELVVSLVIEIWKLRKLYKISLSSIFPFVHIQNLLIIEKTESVSYEEEAIRITVKIIFIPLASIYLLYRIYYYSFYIHSHPFRFVIEYLFFLLNIFGFALMTPQIYINYKMKSVENLPIKALAYKFLNTIIDDVFAFALDTPTLHRISVFKDDVIFVIFIVQMYLYRKNRKRHLDENDEKEKEKEKKNEMVESKEKVE